MPSTFKQRPLRTRRRRRSKTNKKALTRLYDADIMNSERAQKTPQYPGVCASRLYFLLHFRNWSPESVHVCHAPVFDARGRQKCAAGHRPTVRRWVKNDGSGTLGFLKKRKVQFGGIRIAPFYHMRWLMPVCEP